VKAAAVVVRRADGRRRSDAVRRELDGHAEVSVLEMLAKVSDQFSA
jgi:hypothetical protein